MHRSSTPTESICLQVRNGGGHGIYIAKDRQITIDKCEAVSGDADCGTYLYSGKQTDEQSDTILRIPKGNLRRNANTSSQFIVDDHCVRITEGSDIDNGTYLYSEKLTCDQPDACHGISERDKEDNRYNIKNTYDDISVH